jgi:hypothetical protein
MQLCLLAFGVCATHACFCFIASGDKTKQGDKSKKAIKASLPIKKARGKPTPDQYLR